MRIAHTLPFRTYRVDNLHVTGIPELRQQVGIHLTYKNIFPAIFQALFT
jgi:hypothetical protein